LRHLAIHSAPWQEKFLAFLKKLGYYDFREETMSTELQAIDRRAASIERPELSPMQDLESRIVREGDIDKMRELLKFRQDLQALQAKQAFVEAMAKFKASPPVIKKNRHVHFDHRDGQGNTDFWHATLDNCCEQICPALAVVGIRHSWAVAESEKGISVTCILTHQMGHSESVTLTGPADSSGRKNVIQQKGSTITYLERYTLLAITGCATVGQDDDGANSGESEPQGETLGDEQALVLQEAMEQAGTVGEVTKAYLAANEAALKIGDMKSAKDFTAIRDRELARVRSVKSGN
jgi:hypothetical protein